MYLWFFDKDDMKMIYCIRKIALWSLANAYPMVWKLAEPASYGEMHTLQIGFVVERNASGKQ